MIGSLVKDEFKKVLIITGHLVLVFFFSMVLASVFFEVFVYLTGRSTSEIGFRLFFSTALLIVVLLYSSKGMGWKSRAYFGQQTIGRQWIKGCTYGSALGAAAISLVVIILVKSGIYSMSVNKPPVTDRRVFILIVLFLVVALSEELLFRGLIFKIAGRYFPPAGVVICSALFFSLSHSLNTGFSLIALINIFLTGVLLGMIMIRQGTLWWPVGFHFSWNLFEGMVFSLPVSGLPVKGILEVEALDKTLANPFWGGSFGPEGTVVATGVLLLLMAMVNRGSSFHRGES